MKRTVFFVCLGAAMALLPAFVFASGKNELTLTIENNTGTHITQVIVEELGSKKGPVEYNRSLPNLAATQIKVKKETQYNIVLINTDNRQFVQTRLAWNDGEPVVSYRLRDIQDRNIWDKAKRVLLWPKYR